MNADQLADRDRRYFAQDELLRGALNAIAAEKEQPYGTPDVDLIEEMEKQARRIAKLFGILSHPEIDLSPSMWRKKK